MAFRWPISLQVLDDIRTYAGIGDPMSQPDDFGRPHLGPPAGVPLH